MLLSPADSSVWWEILIIGGSHEAAKEIRDTMVNILDSIA